MTYPSTSATAAFVAEAKRRFTAAGIAISVVSGGGTPNAWHAHEIAGLTEVRVGTYIYHDRATVAAGAASLDECALHLHATVVSRPTDDRAVIDAGSKSLSSDLVATSVGTGLRADPRLSGCGHRAAERGAWRHRPVALRHEARARRAHRDRAEPCLRGEQSARRGRA